MNINILGQVLRFVGLVLLQALVLRRLMLEWQSFAYFNILVYPLFIFLLPLATPRWAQILLAFFLGLFIDLFYDSPGVHASASVFIAYIRPYILFSVRPRGGYGGQFRPTLKSQGFGWFFRYASILLLLHLLWYHTMDAFSLAHLGDILLRTLSGYLFSMAGILLIMFIFNPSE